MKLLRVIASNKLGLLKFLKTQKGFTLIELLVVIGVLGILATGLLATIDPLEQFRKGGDSNERTTALELENALTRYYATHQTFPWRPTAEGGPATPCNGGTNPSATQVSTPVGTTGFNDCLTVLINEGELKTSFQSQYGILGRLYVTDTTAGNAKSAAVCYSPQSKSESLKAETHWSSAAVDITSSGCPKVGGTCYWCAQ